MAIATLRNCLSAQAQFQACARADEDRDGTGEFGTFGEMTGAVPGRADRVMVPPVLSGAFKKLDERGRVHRNGYVYAIFLPGPAGRPIGERAKEGGVDPGLVDADLAEMRYGLYAWPKKYGETGRRTYFVNQVGDVLSTDCPRYSGENGPEPDAALVPDPHKVGTLLGKTAIGMKGRDGNEWKQSN
jgi:hypothetical protein